MKSLRKVTEGLNDSKRKTSDNAVAGLFPFQTEENLKSFERSCLNEIFREAVVGCSLLFVYFEKQLFLAIGIYKLHSYVFNI